MRASDGIVALAICGVACGGKTSGGKTSGTVPVEAVAVSAAPRAALPPAPPSDAPPSDAPPSDAPPSDVPALDDLEFPEQAETDTESLMQAVVGNCAAPCRVLGRAPLVTASLKALECKEDWEALGDDCEHWDYLRNCVYADKGYVFKKARWRNRFGATPWYKEDPAFKSGLLSRVARNNVASLKQRAQQCKLRASRGKKGKTLGQRRVDLHGTGTRETVKVSATHVAVSGKTFAHGLPADRGSVTLKVVDIDSRDKRQELLLRVEEYEDIGVHVVVYSDGETVRPSQLIYGPPLRIDGKGTIRVQSRNCGQEYLNVYAVKAKRLRETLRKISGIFDENECAACPYVYVASGTEWQLQGEILRDLHRPSKEGEQALGLGRRSGTLRIRIAEEKREITYADEFFVIAVTDAGEVLRLAPLECSDASVAFCQRDGDYHVLLPNSAVELTFDLPEPAEVRLVASGHYRPLPAPRHGPRK